MDQVTGQATNQPTNQASNLFLSHLSCLLVIRL